MTVWSQLAGTEGSDDTSQWYTIHTFRLLLFTHSFCIFGTICISDNDICRKFKSSTTRYCVTRDGKNGIFA